MIGGVIAGADLGMAGGTFSAVVSAVTVVIIHLEAVTLVEWAAPAPNK